MSEPVVLWISGSYSTCGACGLQTLPEWETHQEVTGYGPRTPGCGARFTHIGTGYDYPDERLHEMRPDLPLYRELIQENNDE